MMLTSAGVLIVIVGPPLIAAFLPVAICDATQPRPGQPSQPHAPRQGSFGRHLVISLPITGLAFGSWLVGSRFSGHDVPDPVVIAIFVALAAVAAIMAAWTACAAAELELATR